MPLHYLTVQDVLWINQQITKKTHRFRYDRLEEAVFYQYAYGESSSLVPQAARFLTGFLKMSPIDEGNAATVFVACLAFLKINGAKLRLSDFDAARWFADARQSRPQAAAGIEKIAVAGEDSHETQPPIRERIHEVIDAYPDTIAALASM